MVRSDYAGSPATKHLELGTKKSFCRSILR